LKWQETGENCIKRSLIIFAPHQVLLGIRMRWAGHVECERVMRNAYTAMVRKISLGEMWCEAGSGHVKPRVGTSDGLSCSRKGGGGHLLTTRGTVGFSERIIRLWVGCNFCGLLPVTYNCRFEVILGQLLDFRNITRDAAICYFTGRSTSGVLMNVSAVRWNAAASRNDPVTSVTPYWRDRSSFSSVTPFHLWILTDEG
jgi:hypothetical protein